MILKPLPLRIPAYIYLMISLFVLIACEEEPKSTEITKAEIPKPKPVLKEFGYTLNDYDVSRDTIKSGDSFGAIMDANGVSRGKVFQISESIKEVFNPARIVAGKAYTILRAKDSAKTVQAFIYQQDKINYTVIDLKNDSIQVRKDKKPVSIKRKTASGIITSSLSAAMDNEGLSVLVADKIVGIYQWKVDFFKIQKGDRFKLIYNEKYIDDTIYAGVKNIEAAVLTHHGNPYYAFQFGKDSTGGWSKYYDEKGESLQSFFLKAPLNFTRISSRYTKRRFHPVQKRWKAHKGTDYAAPRGTPIWSTADGIVTHSSYTRGNGNYVKVRHNEKYTTQYLHMSKRKAKVGQRVKQGDIIGYVGSTGLATGPHVCYRFWVYGKQVDPFKQNLPNSEPLPEKLKPEYFKTIEPLKNELDALKNKKL